MAEVTGRRAEENDCDSRGVLLLTTAVAESKALVERLDHSVGDGGHILHVPIVLAGH